MKVQDLFSLQRGIPSMQITITEKSGGFFLSTAQSSLARQVRSLIV